MGTLSCVFMSSQFKISDLSWPSLYSLPPQEEAEPDLTGLWSGVRAMVANRLGREGEQWSSLISQNSGKSGQSRQWLVLDYRRLRAGYSRQRVVWLVQVREEHSSPLTPVPITWKPLLSYEDTEMPLVGGFDCVFMA